MTVKFGMDYHKAIYTRYRNASNGLKSRILDEFCRVCGYNRKYAIRKLAKAPQESKAKGKARTGRKKTYDRSTIAVVQAVWEAANYPWSTRLKEILRLWLPWIKKHYALSPELEQKLLAISPSTLDRCLKSKKDKLKRRVYGRTKPGTLLKHHIPIKTDHWDVKSPGFVEVDLVSHSGTVARGEFLHSLNLTDVHSGWVETRAVLGNGETGVLEALKQIRHDLPFALLGLDSDNGSEFINYHLLRYCQKENIQFTRSRPYKKDDNAHIEQKNWTHVRKLMGWDRYDSPQALQAMNALYQKELRLWMNLYKRGLSALLLQRQLGLHRYETAWMMLHKLRRAMVNVARELLHDEVEVDDTWIGAAQAGLRGSCQLKGRKAALIVAAVEKRGKGSGRIRMEVIHDFTGATMNDFVQRNVTPGSTIYTDGLSSFAGLEKIGFKHVPRTQPLGTELRKGAMSVVPLADRAIGNLQQWLVGTHHGVSGRHLQVYLDEFVFRHNRRKQPMAAFQTLLGLGSARKPTPYVTKRGAKDLSSAAD